jgi:hypothetical protein
MITVFRTDSTDLFKPGRTIADPQAPRMMRLEARLFSTKWESVGAIDVLIKPDNWVPNAGATATHGITERMCALYGVRARAALAALVDFVRCSREVAAWGLPFHSGVIDVELHRLRGDASDWKRGGLKRTCIMEMASSKVNMGRPLTLESAWEKQYTAPLPAKIEAAITMLKGFRA